MSPFWSHSFSMRKRDVNGADKWLSNGQSDINYWFGPDAEELILPGEPASGDLTGKIATRTLSPTGSPNYQQPYTGEDGDPLSVSMDGDTTDNFTSDDGTEFDYDTTAFAQLYTVKRLADITYSAQLTYKYGSGGPNGYRAFFLSNNNIQWRGYSPTGTVQASIGTPLPLTPSFLFMWRSITNEQWGISCSYASENTDTFSATHQMSNGILYRIGDGLYNAAPIAFGPIVYWSGANAETVIANRTSIFPIWWSS